MAETIHPPITARTRLCAVFGHPIRHSASPAMHNAAFAALGLDWRYVAFDVLPEQVRDALEGARSMHFVGVNLTVPHKLLARDWVDILDEEARPLGAVNTVVFEGQDDAGEWKPLGQWPRDKEVGQVWAKGYNTDAEALLRALQEDLGFTPAGSRVLLLGAGGAGRVAALKLASAGVACLGLHNRTRAKAEALAREIQPLFPQLEICLGVPQGKLDLVLNATSAGLRPGDECPLERAETVFRRTGAVYDMIYRPAETPFLSLGRAQGCRAANGLSMLLYQGARALELWCGRPAPLDIMRQALDQAVYGNSA